MEQFTTVRQPEFSLAGFAGSPHSQITCPEEPVTLGLHPQSCVGSHLEDSHSLEILSSMSRMD